jgi:uncharacterized protein (DUF1330 family)
MKRQGERLIIGEFPDMARARAWYRSPEYAETLTIRPRALDRRLIFVDGIAPASKEQE